jgi:DNA segregation ATPase FtsK/SpoIIIE, S-DNA-T family
MRKEIIGILLLFLVIFTMVSLASFSHDDPSIHNATANTNIQNLFGILGAHVSGALTGLFGLGSFWVPILLFLSSLHFFKEKPNNALFLSIAGGIILIVTTGSLFSLAVYPQHFILLFETRFSSGGLVCIPLTSLLIKYSNFAGAAAILALLWLISLMMATRFSLIKFLKQFQKAVSDFIQKINTTLIKKKERRKKNKKRVLEEKNREARGQSEIEIKTGCAAPPPVTDVPVLKQRTFDFIPDDSGFQLPSVNLLDSPQDSETVVDDGSLIMQSKLLEKKLEDFAVYGKVATVSPGPVITTFEYAPAPGVKINKVVNLSDDLALALRAISIRIVAPIPGKAVIGIEIPNTTREVVRLKAVVVSDVFEKSKSKLTLCLGKDIVGNPVVADLAKMPHLLIAGATGTGKSVALNTMICSFLYKAEPDEVKFIMVDPKRIELSSYDGIPHLVTPVVTNVKKATNALFWAVKEMERRYELLAEKKAKNFIQYNKKIESENKADKENPAEKLPYIVIIIDELADLMMVASRDVEVALTRLAQMARASGIHLILATQRPSVDVLTGVIKANFPTRLTFQVSSKVDSRTIIDTNGAENLLGNGDMLFLPPGTAKLQRIHGAYISEPEFERIVDFVKNQKAPEYNEQVTETPVKEEGSLNKEDYDEKYDEAVALVTKTRQASISMIQRHMRIGYNRAARIIEVMEKEGVVGPSDGAKPREVLVRGYDD